MGIALLHILASGVDQFISNVIHGEGYAHQVRKGAPIHFLFIINATVAGSAQNVDDMICADMMFDFRFAIRSQVVRDLGFMIPDVLHLLIPFLALIRARLDSHSTRSFWRDCKLHKDIAATFFMVVTLFTVCSFL